MQTLDIQVFPLGPTETNCYILQPVGSTEAWMVDPGIEPQPALAHLARHGLGLSRILITHGHADHIGGLAEVKQVYPDAVITASAGDACMHEDARLNLSAMFYVPIQAPPPDEQIHPGEVLRLGSLAWTVLDTAGHTPGGISFYCPAEQIVFVGDALFAGSVGRCDLPGSDYIRLIRSIRQNLLTLPPQAKVLPGHGPATTIAEESAGNPFLR